MCVYSVYAQCVHRNADKSGRWTAAAAAAAAAAACCWSAGGGLCLGGAMFAWAACNVGVTSVAEVCTEQ